MLRDEVHYEFPPSIGDAMTDAEGNVTPGFCEVVEFSTIVYRLGEDTAGNSQGDEACSLDRRITRSTQFPEDGVTNLHCCYAAWLDPLILNDLYCQVEYEFSETINVVYDAENEVCTQTEGTSQKQYRDQAGWLVGSDDPVILEN